LRHLDEGGISLEPGIVDEDVDPFPLLQHLGEHVADVLLAGDVGPDRDGVTATPHDVIDDPLGAGGIGRVVDRDRGAGSRECPGHSFADARTGSGDQRLLPFEWLNVHTPRLLVRVRGCATGWSIVPFKWRDDSRQATVHRAGRSDRPLSGPRLRPPGCVRAGAYGLGLEFGAGLERVGITAVRAPALPA
jgi:hypothetical protein